LVLRRDIRLFLFFVFEDEACFFGWDFQHSWRVLHL